MGFKRSDPFTYFGGGTGAQYSYLLAISCNTDAIVTILVSFKVGFNDVEVVFYDTLEATEIIYIIDFWNFPWQLGTNSVSSNRVPITYFSCKRNDYYTIFRVVCF